MDGLKERMWNANFVKVNIGNFMLFFAFYLLMPLLPLYLSETFHATKDVIGAVLSGYVVAALVARPFSGYIVDSFPRKKVLMVCFFLFFIFFAGYLTAGTLLLFTIIRTLHGAPFGALTVANSTVAIDVLPSSRRSEGIAFYGLSNNLAMAIGPTVAVFIYDYVGSFELLFWMALIIAGIGYVVSATIHLKPRELNPPRQAISLDRFFLTIGWRLFMTMIAFGCSYGVLSTYIAIYSKDVLGVTSGSGTFFLILAVGLMMARFLGAASLRQGRITHNATLGMLTSIVGYSLFVLVHNPWGYYGAAILIGLGNGHMWPAYQNMFINLATHSQRGTANSTLLVAWDVGIGLGVVGGGVIAEYLGYTAAFWASVIVNVMGIAGYLLAGRSHYLRHKLR